MKKPVPLSKIAVVAAFLLVQCNNTKTEPPVAVKENFNGFESQVKWGNTS